MRIADRHGRVTVSPSSAFPGELVVVFAKDPDGGKEIALTIAASGKVLGRTPAPSRSSLIPAGWL